MRASSKIDIRDFRCDFILILFGGLFLFDPNMRFVDPLDDAIGYLFIFVGLLRLSDICERLNDAKRAFGLLLGIGLVQLLAEILIHDVLADLSGEMNEYELPTAVLICAFLLMLAKLLLLIPALRKLFLGLAFLAERTEGKGILTEKKGRTRAQRISRFSTAFVVLSSVLSVLPELTVLTSLEGKAGNTLWNDGTVGDTQIPFEEWFQLHTSTSGDAMADWFPYADLFRIGLAAIVAILGIIWLVSYIRFFVVILKDRPWLLTLRERYEKEVLPQVGMLTVRRFHGAFLCFFVGAIFTASLRISYIPVLPDFILALSVAIGMLLLGKLAKGKGLVFSLSASLFAVSIAHLVCNLFYLKQYVPKDSLYLTKPYYAFLWVKTLGALEALLTLALMLSLLRALLLTLREHTGVSYENEATLSFDATKRLHTAQKKKMILLAVLFSLCGVGCLLDALLYVTLPWLWLAVMLLSLITIWIFLCFLQDQKEQIEIHYHSDGMNKKSL